METVAVIGASENPEAPSNLVCQRLVEHGCRVYAITRHGRSINGAIGKKDIADIIEKLDTVTLYIGPTNQASIIDAIIEKRPTRVIFNPGTECEVHESRLNVAGIATIRACTLVLLKTNRY